MVLRRILWSTVALLFLVTGAGVAYFAISIPNDIRAEALLRKAEESLRDGRRDESRTSLEKIVRQYPRTDAAAAAAQALFRITAEDNTALRRRIDALEKNRSADARRIAALTDDVARMKEGVKAPVVVTAPAPKPPPVAKKKPVTVKRTPPSRRRRR